MTTVGSPAPVPVPDVDTAGFWAARERASSCCAWADETGDWIHSPQERSPSCGPTHFEEVSGRGRIFSFIVVRQATVPADEVPYVVGAIELDEQPRLRLTGQIDADPEIVEIGAAVRARSTEAGAGDFRAPRVRPDLGLRTCAE